jgi:hypothetical protein
MTISAPPQDYGSHDPPGGCIRSRLGPGLPFARPRVSQPFESNAFKNNSALRQGIDEQISRSLGYRVSSAGSDDGPVRATATEPETGPTAIKSREPTFWMSIKPADTRWLALNIRNVASVVCGPRADGLGQLPDNEVVASAEGILQNLLELQDLFQSVHSLHTADVRRVDPVAFLCQIENEDCFERTDSKSVPQESVHHVFRIVVGKEFPLESDPQATVILDLLKDRRICVSDRQGRVDDRVVRVVSRSQSCYRRQDFDSLVVPRELTALVVETGQDFCKVDHLEANVANRARASRESKAMRNAV